MKVALLIKAGTCSGATQPVNSTERLIPCCEACFSNALRAAPSPAMTRRTPGNRRTIVENAASAKSNPFSWERRHKHNNRGGSNDRRAEESEGGSTAL